MSIFSIFGGGKKNNGGDSPKYEPIPYTPSKYDAADAAQLNDFYSTRARGENTGFNPEDMATMEGQAQDHSTRNMNEAIRRGGASRRVGTGGTYSGGRDVMRDEAIRGGLEYRSNAMRDIAVRNAVQKHTDQWQGAAGLGNFLNSERANALSIWTGQNQQNQQAYTYNELYPSLTGQANNQYQAQQTGQSAADIAKILASVYSAYKTNQGS
jgi:hypothetical protein